MTLIAEQSRHDINDDIQAKNTHDLRFLQLTLVVVFLYKAVLYPSQHLVLAQQFRGAENGW